MASTYTDLGLELMATGENAGTWGTKTNANLSLIEQLTGGVIQVSIAGGVGTTDLDIDDGALTGTAQQRIIELTGSITGNRIVTFPVLTENFYIIKNGTTNGSGTPTVQLKAKTGSGATVTFSATDKGYKLIYLDGVATNTGLFEADLSGVTTSPGGSDKQLQFNDNGSFGGITMGSNNQILASNGTTASFVDNSGITTGKAIAMAMIFG